MGSLGNKPHAVCIPYPAQGHINPMLKLAKLLHHKGFHITFVNSEFNHRRLLRSHGPDALDGFPSFRFETIPDGLPPSDTDATQDIPSLCQATSKFCLSHFRELLSTLNDRSLTGDVPPVSCVVSDGVMSFTLDAAEEIGVPEVLFWTTSACGLMGYIHYQGLIDRGYSPLKDATYLTNGYLDTVIDWIPQMKNITLKYLPSFIRTTDPADGMLEFTKRETSRATRASAILLNTFYDLEHEVLDGFKTMLPPVHPIGPLQYLLDDLPESDLKLMGSNLWKEDQECLHWLDSKEPSSVVYVNFGSITVVTAEQLVEFAWGLAKSNQTFLWVIRPDLVSGESTILPPGFVDAARGRSLMPSWCPQEKVLSHPAVGGFLTHCGWNSTLESICAGVPVICWPFFAEQQTNCWYNCGEWGIGTEIDSNVKRDEVEVVVRELMEGEKGKEMKRRAMTWKKKAHTAAVRPTGSSYLSLESLINDKLLRPRK
ncbi:hypothetical protein SAY86_003766 [Trapa natans]|uniref:Glycosyltransferase n=1 Tax=Trapa natans TaxID=22666 RepID=A0AAN7MEJ0_TRANT|nr:hypothetical protein SAY86_003766 [Trapa natans]